MLSSSSARDRARRVIRTLRSHGHRALFAGGCVRDELLGREPSDYDVATSARPAEVRACFRKTVPVGEKYGVVLAIVGGEAVEVATFRRDAIYADGRRPVAVEFSEEPEEDARRRDFTVNGLFRDPDTGEVLDYVGGREDAMRGRIRTIGDPDERFDEDRLRLLRAVRLGTSLGFEIETATFRAIRRRAPEVATVSGERVRDELLRILIDPARRRGLELLLATGLMAAILPEVAAMVDVPQPPRYHPEGDVWTHSLVAVSRVEARDPVLVLATLLHDVGKPGTIRQAERVRFDGHPLVGEESSRAIARRLRLSRAESDRIAVLVRQHLRFMDVRRMREARLRRFLTDDRAEDHLALHRADCLASHGDLSGYEFCLARRAEYSRESAPPPRYLTGRDLIRLGFEPGPGFASILGELEDLTLEGRIRSRDEALEWVLSRGGEKDHA